MLEMVVMILVFLALWPVLGQHRVTDFMIFCILVLSFDLLYGYMGRLSFGHVLYYGIGAYICSAFIVYVAPNPLLGRWWGFSRRCRWPCSSDSSSPGQTARPSL